VYEALARNLMRKRNTTAAKPADRSAAGIERVEVGGRAVVVACGEFRL